MKFKSGVLVLGALLVFLAACNDNLPTELAGLADQKSLDRLATLPGDADLLLALQSAGILGKLPHLGSQGRKLGHFGPTTLVEVSQDLVPELAKVEGLTGLVLWGDGRVVEKIDPPLRDAILGGMARSDWRETEYSVIGTFSHPGPDLKNSLAESGAIVGRVSGDVVTFRATSEVIFDLLARDDLSQLKKPNLQYPLQGLN